MGESSAQSFCLKILVAKDEKKVIMAESNKEFIEVLFSFMAMPIASAVRHTRNCLSGEIGCWSNLYGSVENLDMNLLKDRCFRDILLNPRSAAEIYCMDLQMNLIESGCNDFYVCHGKDCSVISYYRIGKCRCGNALKHMIRSTRSSRFFPEEEGCFLKSTARFIITDDFKVMPVATMADVALLNELEKYGKIEEKTIKIGRDEVLNLLKCSFISKTPLSETFLEPSFDTEPLDMKYGPGGMDPPVEVKGFRNRRTKIHLKLIFDKVNNIALYAVAKEDFVNMLCTFLTFPLGYIFNRFPCLSFEGCIGNLHKSIQDTDINLFCREERKDMLVNPKLAPGLAYNGNLISIEEATIPSECSNFSLLLGAKCKPSRDSNFNIVSANPPIRIMRKTLFSNSSTPPNPNIPCYHTEDHMPPAIKTKLKIFPRSIALSPLPISGTQKVFDGFVKGPATFLVMDNMEVKPLSPLSAKLLVDRLMVPLSDIGEQEVILDEDKAMRLLAASLASKHALTSTFLHKENNVDCLDFVRLMWGGKGIGFKGY